MNLRLQSLTVICKRAKEIVTFADVTYFYGEIGAGKSSIAQLVDYCLGGSLHETPALQSEFVEAELLLTINSTDLILSRPKGATTVHASWTQNGESLDVLVPAREAKGEVIPGSSVEVLSDLLFHLAGLKAPRVRKSKLRDDSDLERLSFRDLLWYCYLDQLHMESDFFHLEPSAEYWMRNKSKDVMRYLLGFHQEHLAELERELDEVRIKRRATEEGARTLREALAKANLGVEADIDRRLAKIKDESGNLAEQAKQARETTAVREAHAVDTLRNQARELVDEITAVEDGGTCRWSCS